MSEPIDDAEIVKSKEYYASLLKDLDVITRPKEDKPFVLPESSVWNRLKLTTLRVKDIHNKHESGFSLEKEIARIDAATTSEFKLAAAGKSPRKSQISSLSTHKVAMKEKDRAIEERLMAPYRNNPGRLADLIEHVKAIEDKNNTEHAIHRKAQAIKNAERQERQESQKLTRGQSGRYSPSAFGAQDQFDSSGGFGVSEKHPGSRFPASGKYGSSKNNAPVESAAHRYMRQAGWLRIVAAASRMALSIEALQAMRDTKAQDVAKWNAAICLQRFWRVCFLRVVMKEAAAVGTGMDSMWTMSSKASSRLRRITRSEKFNFNAASIPEGEENELQRLLKGRQQVAQSRVREEACAQILVFLRDLDKLFRNRVMKFIRQVKILQAKVRVHIAVTRARTQVASMWFERSLPALCLHVRIVLAGRGLDLRNLTANDRENIRQMELQYAEYRYVNTQPSQPDDDADSDFGFPGPPKVRAPVYTGPTNMALIKHMHTAQFHAFLRAHHELIVGSGFLAQFVPAALASPLPSPHLFGNPTTPSHARQGIVSAALKRTAISGLVLKNRRLYMKKSTKKTAVVFEKFVVTMEDARSFIRDGRDSLCEHLLDLGLKDAVSAGMRVRQLMGGKRLGFGAGAAGGSGAGSSGTSRRASIKRTVSGLSAEPGPPRDSPSRKNAGKSEKFQGGSASSKTRARSRGLAATASSIPTALLLSRMPLPPVFLLLSSLTAEDMALLYFDLADKMRRLAPVGAEKAGRGGKGSLASQSIGRSVSGGHGEHFHQPSISLHTHSSEASHRSGHTPTSSSSSNVSHLHEGASHLFVQVTTPTHAHAHPPHHNRYPSSSAVGGSPMLRRLK